MDNIKEWAIGITLISFAGGITFILLPKGNTARTVKSVLSVIIILSCVVPLSKIRSFENQVITESRYYDYENSELSRTVDRQKLEFVEERLSDEVKKILKKYSAEAVKICFDDNIDSEGRIVIDKVRVYLRKEYSYLQANIRDDVSSVLGVKNEVIIYEPEIQTPSEKEVDG